MARTQAIAGLRHATPRRRVRGAAACRTEPLEIPRGAPGWASCVLLPLLLLCGACADLQPARISVWVQPELYELTPDGPAAPENPIFSASGRHVRLAACANETIALQVGLRASLAPLSAVDVRVGELRSESGDVIGAAQVTRERVSFTRVERFASWYADHARRRPQPGAFADALAPWDAPRGGGPLRLGADRNEYCWIDIHVPAKTPAGRYSGKLDVLLGAAPLASYDLLLTVIPAELPANVALPIFCRIEPRDLLAEHLRWPDVPAEQTRLSADDPSHASAIALLEQTLRLFAAHRMQPLLWTSLPRYQVRGPQEIEVDWAAYDALVQRWLDPPEPGQSPLLSHWLAPLSIDYPDAQRNGGVASADYARLLNAYARSLREHFAQRGWLERTWIRPLPPGVLSAARVEQFRRLQALLKDAELSQQTLAHFPARSLRGLGWHNAPDVSGVEPGVWATPAGWLEPAAMRQEQSAGRGVWLMPDRPPYSPALAVESPAVDPALLAWIAGYYRLDGVWIEHAAEFAARGGAGQRGALIAPGTPFGIRERPLATVRLKRLRRGQQDHALLTMLSAAGKSLLATRTAQQVVGFACLEACDSHLLDVRDTGWSRNPELPTLARSLVLRELSSADADTPASQRLANLADWERLMTQAAQVQVSLRGVRLERRDEQLRAAALVSVDNRTDAGLNASWSLSAAQPGLALAEAAPLRAAANARQRARLELALDSLRHSPEGITDFRLMLKPELGGPAAELTARLAVSSCLFVADAPVIDAVLDEWLRSSSNTVGDFQLVRGQTRGADGVLSPRPTRETQASFCFDDEWFYVAVRCELDRSAAPTWKADNVVPLDGAIPWGQDLVELLLNPTNRADTDASELLCIQVKPSGLLLARRGPRTDPPTSASVEWQSGARVASRIGREAWVIELAIPLTSLGKGAVRSPIWGVNVTRLDAGLGEYSSWSGARGHAYSAESLGNLILLRP